jgi:flagellar biosynthetic protein FlhB
MADQSNNTEKASPRKLEKAREEGKFPVSRDLVSAAQFLTFLTLLAFWGRTWWLDTLTSFHFGLASASSIQVTPEGVIQLTRSLMRRIFIPFAQGAGILVLATLATHLLITRFGFSAKKFSLSFSKLNPIDNFKNLKRHNPGALLQASVLMVLFAFAFKAFLTQKLPYLATLPFMNVAASAERVFQSVDDLLWKAGGVFLIFGAVDLGRQQLRFMKDMRMSKQDVRDESKEMDGNPHVKARLRTLRRGLLRRRMMQDVPTATAVIVNPTHYAVAIRYCPDSQGAPLVVAKGKNYLALRIRQKALDHQVALIENPPLARALYGSVEVGHEIPPNFYQAVAEILAYVHRMLGTRFS